MSKKLIRKGLAIGASVSLALAGVVGITAPAQAAGELTIQPNTGTELVIPAINTFVMKATYNTGNSPANAAKLKALITTAGGFQVNADGGSSAGAAVDGLASKVASNVTSGVQALGANPGFLGLAINAADGTTTYSVTVQAWEDANDNGTIETGEWTSAPQTVTFIKTSDIVWTTSVDPVFIGHTGKVSGAITSNVNLSQLVLGDGSDNTTNGTQVVAAFAEDSTTAGTYSLVDAAVLATTYDSVDNALYVESTANVDAALAAGDRVLMNIWFGPKLGLSVATTGWTATIPGSGSLIVPGAGGKAISSQFVRVIGTNSITAVGQPTSEVRGSVVMNAATTALVKTGTTSVPVSSTVTAVSTKSGITVDFEIAEDIATSSGVNTLDAAAVISVNGKDLKNTNAGSRQRITTTAVTDADGKASLTLALAGLKAGNKFTVTASGQGVTPVTTTYTVADPTIGAIANTNAVSTAAATSQLVFAKDAAFSLTFGVKDQFGAPITDAGYTVSASESSTTIVGSVVNGVATLTWPAYATTGARTIAAQGKKNGVNAGSSVNVEVTIGAESTPAQITIAAGAAGLSQSTANVSDYGAATPIVRNIKPFTAVDTRTGGFAPEVTANSAVRLSGQVLTSTGAGALASVTISATGVDFVAGGVYARNTITVRTTSTGAYSVDILSAKPGSSTVTITSGAISRTQVIKFAAVSDQDGKSLTISAPKSVKSGRTVSFQGQLVDAFGNPVTVVASATRTFSVSYSGPGFATAMPTSTDVNGRFFVNVLLGASDTGIGTLSVTYDGDTPSTATLATLTASQSVWVGPIANAKAGANKGNVVVEAYRAKGKTVSVFVGSTRVASYVADKANFSAVVRGVKSGNRNVSVRLSGPGEDFRGVITVK